MRNEKPDRGFAPSSWKNREATFSKYQRRLVVNQNEYHRILKVEEVVLFYVADKSIFAVTKNGELFQVSENLAQLQALLDPNLFFRANRRYLINGLHVSGYQKLALSKLRIKIKGLYANQPIVLNAESSAQFKNWIRKRVLEEAERG